MVKAEIDSLSYGAMVVEDDEESEGDLQDMFLRMDEALRSLDQEVLDELGNRHKEIVELALEPVTFAEVVSVETDEERVVLGYRDLRSELILGLQIWPDDMDELFVEGMPRLGDLIWVLKDKTQWVEKAEVWVRRRVD